VSLNVAEMDALNVSLHGADAVDASAAAAAAVKVSLSASLGSDGAAADALAEYTPSAFADTVRTASRPAAAARAGAEIAPRIFEQELEPA
jgi:hypothetical protein